MNHTTESHRGFFHTRVPLWLAFVVAAVATLVILFIVRSALHLTASSVPVETAPVAVDCDLKIQQHRVKGQKLTSPLLFVDVTAESDKLNDVKSSVQSIIERQKCEGAINSASVYVKVWGNGEWFSINPDESFYTASLMKVAVLITILKMSENIPGYLDRNYPFRYADPHIAPQTFRGMTIIPGRDYKIRDLLYYMIVYSDNYASNVLNNLMDLNTYTRLFADVGIEGYDPQDQFRKMKASDVGKLFRVLFNSSYLNESNSEFALSLLAQSSFSEGLVKELPQDVTVAHKFGEGGGTDENQLSEGGIVYLGKTPYLIVVMTRGKQLKDLTQSVSEISKEVYNYLASHINQNSAMASL